MRAAKGNMEGIRSSCVLSCYSSITHFRLHHQPLDYPFLCLPLPLKRRYTANPEFEVLSLPWPFRTNNLFTNPKKCSQRLTTMAAFAAPEPPGSLLCMPSSTFFLFLVLFVSFFFQFHWIQDWVIGQINSLCGVFTRLRPYSTIWETN